MNSHCTLKPVIFCEEEGNKRKEINILFCGHWAGATLGANQMHFRLQNKQKTLQLVWDQGTSSGQGMWVKPMNTTFYKKTSCSPCALPLLAG